MQDNLEINMMNKNNTSIFAIHGGGNIGLGLMADIVSHSPKHYKIIATSSNQFTNEIINHSKEFWLKHQTNKQDYSSQISSITMLNSKNPQNIIRLYTKAKMGAICLTEEAIKKEASLIAEGLIMRHKFCKEKLKLLVVMNKQNCDKFVRNEISNALKSQVKNSTDCEQILQNVQFVPTVADRIVSKIADGEVLDQIKNKLNSPNKKFLTQKDITKLREEFNHKFYLFNAEKNYSLYVPNYLSEARDLPGTTTVDNLNLFMTVKNKYINGSHAVLAWLGGLMGYTTIAKAIKNPQIRKFISTMMEEEIAPILMAEFSELTEGDLLWLKDTFIERCEMNSTDTIKRVGRDPMRKLNGNGCVRGVLDLKQKNNLNIVTSKLEKGIAAAMLYAIQRIDPHNHECEKMFDIYRTHHSISSVLCYNGPYGNGKYIGLDPIKDREVISNVLYYIQQNEDENVFAFR